MTSPRNLAIVATLLAIFSPASPAAAQEMLPAEAAAELFFFPLPSTDKDTVVDGVATYRGNQWGDADRRVISVAPSRSDPCLFEAFVVETFAPIRSHPAVMFSNYVVSIDLRRPDEAAIEDTPQREPGGSAEAAARLVIRGAGLYCSRAAAFDETLAITFVEDCLDEIANPVVADFVPRLRTALEVLGKACQW